MGNIGVVEPRSGRSLVCEEVWGVAVESGVAGRSGDGGGVLLGWGGRNDERFFDVCLVVC